MKRKQAYITPKMYKVSLNHEQAVLGQCATSVATAQTGGGADAVCIYATASSQCKNWAEMSPYMTTWDCYAPTS